MSENLDMRNIWTLHNYTFEIPYQQRGYKWTENNIEVLLEDLSTFLDTDTKSDVYCLQPVAVVPLVENQNKYSVIDGQQRLTTLYLLYKYLVADGSDLTEEKELYHYEYERDNDNKDRTMILRKKIDSEDDRTIDSFYITRAYNTILKWFKDKKDRRKQFQELIEKKIKDKSIQIIWYEVDKEKAHETFRNINSGKIQLTNTDLIKALLLNRDNILQDNEVNKEQIAAQFEQMESLFNEDRFWFMLQKHDVDRQKGQTRMDLLFNLVAGIKAKEYEIEPRSAFFKFSKLPYGMLLSKWKEVRENFQRIQDIFDDPYTFHYVGFLNFCGEQNISDFLKKNEEFDKSKYVQYLRNSIRNCLCHKKIEEYNYNDSKNNLLRVFILHNIETILHRYELLKKELNLKFYYEYFPFELLYSQTWDIEHIASQTDNELKRPEERKDWIKSIKSDYPEIFSIEIKKLEEEAKDFSNDETFKNLYEKIMSTEIIKDILKDSIKKMNKKNGIGNLVMLDAHTNRFFHNSLFPRKRRIVILASGLRHNDASKDEEEHVKSVYVPLCTQQVYTKFYNKNSDVKLNAWTDIDYEAYVNDMKEKLHLYFN